MRATLLFALNEMKRIALKWSWKGEIVTINRMIYNSRNINKYIFHINNITRYRNISFLMALRLSCCGKGWTRDARQSGVRFLVCLCICHEKKEFLYFDARPTKSELTCNASPLVPIFRKSVLPLTWRDRQMSLPCDKLINDSGVWWIVILGPSRQNQ